MSRQEWGYVEDRKIVRVSRLEVDVFALTSCKDRSILMVLRRDDDDPAYLYFGFVNLVLFAYFYRHNLNLYSQLMKYVLSSRPCNVPTMYGRRFPNESILVRFLIVLGQCSGKLAFYNGDGAQYFKIIFSGQ